MSKGKIEIMNATDWIDPRVECQLKYTGDSDFLSGKLVPYEGSTGLFHFSYWFPTKKFGSRREYVSLEQDELAVGRVVPGGLNADQLAHFKAFGDLDEYLLRQSISVEKIDRELESLRIRPVSSDDMMSFFNFSSPVFAYLLNEKGYDPWFLVQ
jgi:hypothetical protein